MMNEAIHAWYRGNTEEAKVLFLQLYEQLNRYPIESCKSIGQFFQEQQMDEQAIACYKRFLDIQFDGHVAAQYVALIIGNQYEVKRLLHILDFYEDRCTDALLLQIIRRLQALNEQALAYNYAIHLLAKLEQQLERLGEFTEDYINVVDFIVMTDVRNGYYTQARFQLRKVLHTNCSIVQFQSIIRWSILLELADEIIARIDYRTIRENVEPVYKQMLLFYEHLQNKQVHSGVAVALSELDLADEWLQYKAQAIIQMTNLLSRKGANEVIVKSLYQKYPYDFLIAQLDALLNKSVTVHSKWFEYFGDLEKGVKFYRQQIVENEGPEVNVTFLGGGEKIGGTAILVEVADRCILLDAGMFLNEEQLLTNIYLIEERGYAIHQLDAIFVSHAHLDHTGSLPYIHSLAPNVPIYATKETKKLMHILLRNVVEHTVDCPYSQQHIQSLIAHISSVSFKQTLVLGQWRVTFYEAGHITGAACIYIEVAGKTILFTGDFSVQPQATCGVLDFPQREVDILITESTYGYMPLASRLPFKQQHALFLSEVERTTERGGCCLIPAFAVGRAQEVLSILQIHYDGFFPFDVYIDGAIEKVCDVYEGTPYFELAERVRNGRDYYNIHTFKRFAAEYSKGSVVVASSGMLNEGSASSKYAYECMDDPASTIIFTGYLDHLSPAYDLYKRRAKSFKVGRESYKEVRAHLSSLSLSAHVNRDDLFATIMRIQPKHVLLMHGEHDKRFKPLLQQGNGTKIYPSIVEMLGWANVVTTCATNKSTYTI